MCMVPACPLHTDKYFLATELCYYTHYYTHDYTHCVYLLAHCTLISISWRLIVVRVRDEPRTRPHDSKRVNFQVRGNTRDACRVFWKVSALVQLLCKNTVEGTFENV